MSLFRKGDRKNPPQTRRQDTLLQRVTLCLSTLNSQAANLASRLCSHNLGAARRPYTARTANHILLSLITL
eukprot:3494727-Amphidinium_carterae.1